MAEEGFDGQGRFPPQKLVNVGEDMAKFENSKAKVQLNALILSLSKAVAGHVIPNDGHVENSIAGQIIDFLRNLERLANEVELFKETQRFGNMAFRNWHDKLAEVITPFLEELNLPQRDGVPLYDEFLHYLSQSFGSKQRLDFGTGHELNFLAFFGGLLLENVAGPIKGPDILAVFAEYYKVCGKLILRFNLEPAGSHGVWGLDDHFHLVYILGSAQLAYGGDDGRLSPKDVLNSKLAHQEASQNLYFWAIDFIHTMKRGNFFEHSPLLFDISNVVSWSKIHRGMIKMYQDEVFGKFPVIQHFWFGRMYSLDPETPTS